MKILDLYEEYNEGLLDDFYNRFMIPNFGIFEGEIADIQAFKEYLDPKQRKFPADLIMHVILFIEDEVIIGGVACEYYPISNCGLLTYIAVDETKRRSGIGKKLVDEVLSVLNQQAIKANKSRCSAIFLETNSDKVSAEKDVMVPAIRQKVLENLGFKILNFDYIQPALSDEQDKCYDLLLTCHSSFLSEEELEKGETELGLSSEIILSWMKEFFIVLMGEQSVVSDEDYLKIQKSLTSTKFITLKKKSIENQINS